MSHRLPQGVATLAVLVVAASAHAQLLTTDFTYQGRLLSAGVPANGPFDFRFELYDAPVAGAQLGPTIDVADLPVSAGLFAVRLDFGAQFDGNRRFLQIRVRPGASIGVYTPLTPRQELTAAPYAHGVRLPLAEAADVPGTALAIANTGSGRAALFRKSAGGGWHTLRIESADPFSQALGIYGGDGGGLFAQSPTGPAIWGNTTGATGPAGQFTLSDATNTSAALQARTAGTGPAVLADGLLQVGTPTSTGSVAFYQDGVATPTFRMNSHPEGAQMYLLSETGSSNYIFEPDYDGEGGFLVVRGDSFYGMTVDGNFAAQGGPYFSLSGPSSSLAVNTNQTGNASVSLPANAISATEILDEPGVANAQGLGPIITPAAGLTTIASRSITVPADGFVIVIATAEVEYSHVSGTASRLQLGVSSTNASLPINQDIEVGTPSGAASGSYEHAVTVHGLFSISAGTSTYYFLGQSLTGTNSKVINDYQLTLLYFPTAYGLTSSNLLDKAFDTEDTPDRPVWYGLTEEDVAAEQYEAEMFAAERLGNELAEMKARLAELEELLKRDPQHGPRPAPAQTPAGSVPLTPATEPGAVE